MIRTLWRDFLAVLRDGFRIWRLAPIIPLLVVIPEAIQHVAEIRIGMFESRDMARAVADDPRRMVWGYLKIAGLLLSILASIRFWGSRARSQKWWVLGGIAWRPVATAVALMAATSAPEWLLAGRLDPAVADGLTLAITVATLPLLVLLVAGFSGDRTATLGSVYRSGWLAAIRMALFAAAIWIPLPWLHGMNHRWAMGGAELLVWLLMAFDSLVVGLLATMGGTAIHHGYASFGRDHGVSPPVEAP